MTKKQLIEKLSKYQDDTEIFIGHLNEEYGWTEYFDPFLDQAEIYEGKTKRGVRCLADERAAARNNPKKLKVLVIS